uniref:Uncharacterized protein n=1 Tax=Anguilla anguilla TaxID=7936 RepID=A0A0E9ULL0_ANGAN
MHSRAFTWLSSSRSLTSALKRDCTLFQKAPVHLPC